MRRSLLLSAVVLSAACSQPMEDPVAEALDPAAHTTDGEDEVGAPDPLPASSVDVGGVGSVQKIVPAGLGLADSCKKEDIAGQTPHQRILNCTPCSPDYSFTLSGVAVCGVAAQPAYDPPQPIPDPPPALDLDKFAAYMHDLDGKTVGYAWALVDTGRGRERIAVSGSSGYATWTAKGGPSGVPSSADSGRDGLPIAAGPGLPMTIYTPTNVGSTTKVLGGVSLLRVFETLGDSRNPQHINLDTFLETPFLYFLPKPAKERAHPSLAQIKIGDLLRHKSGLRLNTSKTPANDLKNLLKEEVTPEEYGVREYNNMGMLIARYLITFLEAPGKRAALEKNPDISTDDLSAAVDLVTRDHYATYVATTMKDAVGNDFFTTCYAIETKGAAWMFDNVVERNGYLYSSKPWGGCSTQGGQWTSVDDWAKFLVALEQGRLISSHARRLMMNGDEDDHGKLGGDRLIWASYNSSGTGTYSKWFEDNYGVGRFYGHGGDHARSADGRKYHAHAGVIRLNWGYYGVAVVNSSELESPALMVQLKNAFAKAAGW